MVDIVVYAIIEVQVEQVSSITNCHTFLQAVFPDNTYGVDSGGDPLVIPKLTFDEFKVCIICSSLKVVTKPHNLIPYVPSRGLS